jgi:hypothetical protein
MGQNQCRVQPFLSLVHHFLLQRGAHVSKQQLKDCLKVVCEYNPWFPEEGTLGKEVWERERKMLKGIQTGRKDTCSFLDNMGSG